MRVRSNQNLTGISKEDQTGNKTQHENRYGNLSQSNTAKNIDENIARETHESYNVEQYNSHKLISQNPRKYYNISNNNNSMQIMAVSGPV